MRLMSTRRPPAPPSDGERFVRAHGNFRFPQLRAVIYAAAANRSLVECPRPSRIRANLRASPGLFHRPH